MLDRILGQAISSVSGARAAIFMDGEGEAIAQAGDADVDVKLVGAWKEIHLDQIRELAKRLGLGEVHAVLFSLDEGTELLVPVAEEYCLLIFLSAYVHVQDAMRSLQPAIELLRKEIV